MNTLRHLLLYPLLCCLCLTACNLAEQKGSLPPMDDKPVELRFNFLPGSTYEYVMDSRMALEPELNGVKITITQDMRIVSAFDVISGAGKDKNIEVTYRRISMRSGNGMRTKEYDSGDPTNKDPLFRSVGALVNKPFGITVSDRGNITNVRGFEGEAGSTEVSGDSSIRKMMVQCLSVYPDTPVKLGDSWKREYASSSGFIHMRVSSTYRLVGIMGTTAQIDINSTITPEDSTRSMIFSGTQSGRIEMDIPSGQITKAEIAQALSGTMEIGGGKKTNVNARSEILITGKLEEEENP